MVGLEIGKQGRSELTIEQLEVLRDLLRKKKNELLFKHRDAEDFVLKAEDRSDEIDWANADAVNAQQVKFLNRDNHYERKIDEALIRIENLEFGLCEECNGPIGYLRLFARPTANLCIFCKEDAERDESNTSFARQSRSRGKMLSYLSSFGDSY